MEKNLEWLDKSAYELLHVLGDYVRANCDSAVADQIMDKALNYAVINGKEERDSAWDRAWNAAWVARGEMISNER